MDSLNATFNLSESDMKDVEISVRARLTNLEFHLGVCELEMRDYYPLLKFYEKVLIHRRKRFNQIKSARNFLFLNKAIYAQCSLHSKIDAGMLCYDHE
jgi:hypothetical protein